MKSNERRDPINKTDALGQQTLNYYDQLGRLFQREDKNSAGTVVADTSWIFDPSYGYLTYVANSNDSHYQELYEYDQFGRSQYKETYVDTNGDGSDTLFKQYSWYDNAGRVSGTASRVGFLQGLPVVANEYNSNGYLEVIRNVADNTIVWQAIDTDRFGNVTTSKSGDGRYVSSRAYDPITGLIAGHSVQRAGGVQLQQLSYQWDTLGNLRSRTDLHVSPNVTETFGYDGLNRLTDANIGADVKSYQYDGFGNLTEKDDTPYFYEETGNAGPHAVTKVGTTTYNYDLNGNQINGDGRTLTYATFGKPTQILKGSTSVQFDYAPSRGRYAKRSYLNGVLNETKITAAGVEVVYKNNTTEVRSYIADALLKFSYAEGSNVGTKITQYLFKDHLGSTDTVVTPNGTLDTVIKMSFGSFGGRRLPANWDTPLLLSQTSALTEITDKGYTGHEQLDDVGLIHMNGRVYDPKLGRFMSADPNIQAPTDTQSLNRYSYVLNNPLSATDPSGYFFKKFWNKVRPFVGAAVAIAGAVYCYNVCTAAGYALVGGIAGAAGAAANGGNILQGAVMGAFSSAVFYGIGDAFQACVSCGPLDANGVRDLKTIAQAGKTLAHAAAGGVMSTLGGGKFGNGFAAAGFTQAVAPGIDGIDKGTIGISVQRAIAAAIVGGTASRLSGGKFANGAVTGAFSRVFNDDSHGKAENANATRRSIRQYLKQLLKLDKVEEFLHALKQVPKGRIGIGAGAHIKEVKIGPLKFGAGVVFASGGLEASTDGVIAWGNSTLDGQISLGTLGGRAYAWDIDFDSNGINNLDTFDTSGAEWDWSIGVSGTVTPYSISAELNFQPLVDLFEDK